MFLKIWKGFGIYASFDQNMLKIALLEKNIP